MTEFEVKVKKLDDKAIVPTYGTAFSAGADLYACIDEKVTIKENETVMIHTGISVEIPQGFGGFVFARSSLGCKRGLAPANKVGVIDSDYRGEIMVGLHNHSGKTQEIEVGERIAQMVILPYASAKFVLADELTDTERGSGGFGSTGKK